MHMILTPCGKCLQCRIGRTAEWTIRLLHEKTCHEESCFITLTYDEDNLPANGTLVKSDLQKFFKRLRKLIYPKKIKYFACGEYGPETLRPHYHAIIFGWEPKEVYKSVGQRKSSVELQQTWSFGNHDFGFVEADSCKYVASYIEGKYSGEMADIVYKKNIAPFSLKSLGLGKDYLMKNADKIRENLCVTYRGKEVGLPRYYCNKLDLTEEEKRELRQRVIKKSKVYYDYYESRKEVDLVSMKKMENVLYAKVKSNKYKESVEKHKKNLWGKDL